jgi:hypothetical protein
MRTAAIIHNFRRPQNLPRIVSACLQAGHRPDVYVLDNSPDDSLRSALQAVCRGIDGAEGRLFYRANRSNFGSGQRYTVAAGLDHDAIASIDDDVFLTPAQIDALLAAYAADTSRVHGIWGERRAMIDGRLCLVNAVHGRDVEVDVLNRTYAFGPQQARVACHLLQTLGYQDWRALGPGSDIVLSFSGRRRPMVHDVGPIETCETSGTPGIAYWRSDNFREQRRALLLRLMAMRARPPGAPAGGPAGR